MGWRIARRLWSTSAWLLLALLMPVAAAAAGPQVDPANPGSSRGGEPPQSILPPELFEELFPGLDEELPPEIREELQEPAPVDRERTISRYEKAARDELRKYDSILSHTQRSTVRIESQGKLIAYGTVVEVSPSEAWLLTKATEVAPHERLICHLTDGSQHRAEVIAEREVFDFALLKISAAGLEDLLAAAPWSEQPIKIGSLLAVGDETGRAFAAGVVSVAERVLIEEQQAVLGVYPEPGEQGVLVRKVDLQSAASVAGLRAGDEILSLDGASIASVVDLTNRIRRKRPGQPIEIRFRRNGRTQTARARLGGRDVEGRFAPSPEQAGRFGSEPSQRNSNFPEVLQHDAHLWPEQCGGPVVDLQGRVIGLNIARGGRIETFAIPAQVAKEVAEEMLKSVRGKATSDTSQKQ